MKISFPMTGTIMVMLLMPLSASATCPPGEQAEALLSLEPVGHYTKAVLERVDNGINKAKGESGGSGLIDLFDLDFLSSIESIFYLLVDTDLRAVEYSRDLGAINTCLHVDLAMMEAKMEVLRCEVLDAYDRESPEALKILKSLANFLNQRYKHLVQGAHNPEHVDNTWQYTYDFDDVSDGWCCDTRSQECKIMTSDECQQISDDTAGAYPFYPTADACLSGGVCLLVEQGNPQPDYEKTCPFDSDYLADNATGYGCDLSVLRRIAGDGGGVEGVHEEVEALEELQATRDAFLENIDHLKETTLSLDAWTDEAMLSPEEREHIREHFGDMRTGEVPHERVMGCVDDFPTEAEQTPKESYDELSSTWSALPLRGPFSFTVDHINVWKEFIRLAIHYAAIREMPDHLKRPDEFFDAADREAAMERESTTFGLQRALRSYMRSLWELYMRNQAIVEAPDLIKTQDTAAHIAESLKPVRAAMRRNVELVNSPQGGLRSFALNYAYFLRRSCIYRPCNEQLETIMKILLTDECFPYASGAFISEEGSTWRECVDRINAL